MATDISQRSCLDCVHRVEADSRKGCARLKMGWVFVRGALVPYWGCVRIGIKDGTQIVRKPEDA